MSLSCASTMTAPMARAAADVVGPESARPLSSRNTDTTWHRVSRSCTATRPRRTVRWRDAQRLASRVWKGTSRKAGSDARSTFWGAPPVPPEAEEEVLRESLTRGDPPEEGASTATLSSSFPASPLDSSAPSSLSSPLFPSGFFLFPKKSKYRDVSTVHSRMRKTDANLVMPTSPCRSLSLSMCARTVLRRSVSRPPQYELRHRSRSSPYASLRSRRSLTMLMRALDRTEMP
mmetsp:Transcript_38620/g.115948  ORF Transcript_38620/g.115948 Transcript_38620/m.115948 type:complete len:232 (-) Transcript_38620:968-1663(-)